MNKYIEYSDPHQVDDADGWVEIIHRIKWEDAAKLMRWIHRKDPRGDLYANDDDAAEDFLIINWGKIIYL
jgi:hypothetical protein